MVSSQNEEKDQQEMLYHNSHQGPLFSVKLPFILMPSNTQQEFNKYLDEIIFLKVYKQKFAILPLKKTILKLVAKIKPNTVPQFE